MSLPCLSTNCLAGDARQADRKDARVGVIVRRNEALVPKLHTCPSMAVALPVPLFFPRQFEVSGVITRDLSGPNRSSEATGL